MKKDLLAAVFLIAMIGMIALMGCRSRTARTKLVAPGKTPTVISGYDPVSLYYVAGLGVIMIGVATFAFGGKGTGAILMASGAGIAYFGQTLIYYPWLSLLVILAMGAVATFIAYDRWRLRQGAGVVALSVQKSEHGAEIKEGIKDQGEDAIKLVRRLIDPEKQRLKMEGKL